MEATIIIITIWYLLNIIWLIYGFANLKTFTSKENKPTTQFTIIVPFRNEAQNLPKLLNSIEELNYPYNLFKVILVDDDSNDGFQISDFRFQISVLKNNRKTSSPKKDAIVTAIEKVTSKWIITTDADCEVPENWLKTYDAFIQENDSKMIASGVFYEKGNSILDCFQQLDLMSLQGTTIGSFGNNQAFMCNGANFAYRKDFFEELKGFEGNESIASGDDVFLLQKAINDQPEKVYFVKSDQTLVKTKTEKTWFYLFQQRVRWASKTGNYSSFYSKQLGLSVFLLNLTCIFTLILWSIGFISMNVFLFIIISKILVDFALIWQTVNSFKISNRYFLPSSIIYPFFSSLVVLFTFFGSYTWKGRSFKK